DWVDDPGDKLGHETYMLKEIREQPATLEATIAEAEQSLHEDGLFSEEELRGLRKVLILGCGTAYHAGVVGRYLVEEWARVPLEFEVASEWRYRNPIVD